MHLVKLRQYKAHDQADIIGLISKQEPLAVVHILVSIANLALIWGQLSIDVHR